MVRGLRFLLVGCPSDSRLLLSALQQPRCLTVQWDWSPEPHTQHGGRRQRQAETARALEERRRPGGQGLRLAADAAAGALRAAVLGAGDHFLAGGEPEVDGGRDRAVPGEGGHRSLPDRDAEPGDQLVDKAAACRCLGGHHGAGGDLPGRAGAFLRLPVHRNLPDAVAGPEDDVRPAAGHLPPHAADAYRVLRHARGGKAGDAARPRTWMRSTTCSQPGFWPLWTIFST